ncbi:hypothetical protein FUT87_07385 [Mitsuaria sp. TWR114]|nr:hypothetical protein FUT87_07385 [Mitsuaria sp. TWR114]
MLPDSVACTVPPSPPRPPCPLLPASLFGVPPLPPAPPFALKATVGDVPALDTSDPASKFR